MPGRGDRPVHLGDEPNVPLRQRVADRASMMPFRRPLLETGLSRYQRTLRLPTRAKKSLARRMAGCVT